MPTSLYTEETLRRLVRLYEASGQPEKAAEYQASGQGA